MNFLRKFKNLDHEKKFYRAYTGIAAAFYLFMIGGQTSKMWKFRS